MKRGSKDDSILRFWPEKLDARSSHGKRGWKWGKESG